jgi:hypothetical protein
MIGEVGGSIVVVDGLCVVVVVVVGSCVVVVVDVVVVVVGSCVVVALFSVDEVGETVDVTVITSS